MHVLLHPYSCIDTLLCPLFLFLFLPLPLMFNLLFSFLFDKNSPLTLIAAQIIAAFDDLPFQPLLVLQINTSTTKLTDTQKLNFLGSAVQLDFMFFEKDNDLCYVSDDGSCIYITLCNWYMCGLLCPVQLCIPLGQGEGGGSN